MKQYILVGLLSGLLMATIPLRAQVAQRDSDARKGSRLELGRTPTTRKTNPGTLTGGRFSLVPNPATSGLDRSINLSRNAPINEHYRTVLVARSSPKTTARTAATETAAPAAEGRIGAAPEFKAEDLLFANDRIRVSNAYPNPADDAAEIDYQFTGSGGDAKLVLLNVLGSPVSEHALERSERKLRLTTRDLATGYYLYQLTVDGKKVATKRLLVRHQ